MAAKNRKGPQPARAQVVLPKVAPPRLDRVVRRAQVAQALVRASDGMGAWVQAAGGSGKTTAVASLAADLGQPVAWLHLDAGDAEPASFFHFLKLAIARAVPGAERALPAWGAELDAESALFARRFARAALEAAPAATLVLDNVHDLEVDSRVHGLAAVLCEELAPAWRVFLLSRDAPSKEYARILGQGRLAVVPPATLAFSKEEIKEALRQRGILVEERLEELWRRSHGWIAGALLLAMQSDGQSGASPRANPGESALVFGYFATQAFAKLASKDQDLLLKTAFLADIAPASASRLAGIADAGRRLEDLAANGMFTTRSETDPVLYRYHDLFREFLQAEARASLDTGELDTLKRESAREFLAMGTPLPGLELLLEAGAWEDLREAVVENAERILDQGHFQALSALLQRVPAATRDTDPWLAYWLGQCQLGLDDDRAGECLSRAYDLFEARADRAGQLLAAIDLPATILNQLKDSSQYTRWLERIEALVDTAGEPPSAYLSLKVVGGLIGTVLISRRIAERTDALVARLMELVPRVADPNLRLQALTHVASVSWRFRRRDLGLPVIAMVESQGLEERASPLLVLHWYYDIITYDCMYGSMARALAYAKRAESIAQATGLAHAQFEALLLHLEVLCDRNDVASARTLFERLQKHADPSRAFARAAVHGFRGRIALLEDDGLLALTEARKALEALDGANWPLAFRTAYFMIETGALAILGRFDEALEACARFRPHFKPHNQEVVDIFAAWIRAAAAQDGDRDESRQRLAEAVTLAKTHDYEHPLRHANRLTTALLARALEEGIEPAFAAAIIARRSLRPPDPAPAAWPFAIRVHCLGGFSLQRAGEAALPTGRSQKVLDLLQYVIARGGEAVPVAGIIKALWPGEGRLGAQQIFDTTLHRLRKLLAADEAIAVADHQVSLNRDLAWVDAIALGRLLDRIEHRRTPPTADELHRLVTLYAGHFLPHRTDIPWAAEARDRLWGRLRRILIDAAGRTGQDGDPMLAERILYFVADRDPVAEDAFLAIMRLHLDRGQPAEALRAYRRCEAALSSQLGIAPGKALQEMAAGIRAPSPPGAASPRK